MRSSFLTLPSRSPTHKPHPNSGCGEFDEGKVIGIVFFETGRNRSEMFEFAEEALDEVTIAVEEGAEGGDVDPSRHRSDVGPGSLISQGFTQGVTVIGPIGEKRLAGAHIVQHVAGALAVSGLALGEFERDRIAVGVDQSVDLRRQSAARAPHASGWSVVPSGGLRTPFFTFAACW